MFLNVYMLILNRQAKQRYFVVGRTESGELRISREALEDIVRRSAAGLSGVKKVKAEIKEALEGLDIAVLCGLAHGYELQDVSVKIQEKVWQKLEQSAGIKVKEVKVLEQQPFKLGWPPAQR